MKYAIGIALLCVSALAQAQVATDAEKQELAAAVQEANTSPFDLIRVLEVHLRKYSHTPLRPEILNLLAKAAVEAHDDVRIVKYGEPTLKVKPNDVALLQQVSRALLETGGKENATRALGYAKRYEDYVIRVPVPLGYDPVKNQEDHDRALAQALLYQANAYRIVGDFDEARRTAALAYIAYPDEPSARAWSEALEAQGKHEEAIARLADAFAIADPRASNQDRSEDRKRLGMNKRASQLRALDPNLGLTDPMKFTLGALGGGKLDLATMRGKVVIFDFWATWCVPCRAQHPLYEMVKERFRDRSDVVFLAVATDEDQQLVAPFLEEHHWGNKVYFDSGLVRLLNIESIPATLIADKQGRLASRMDGFSASKFVDQLTARIQAALSAPEAEK